MMVFRIHPGAHMRQMLSFHLQNERLYSFFLYFVERETVFLPSEFE